MYLVGLHIYYKMIHGPYNIKLFNILIFFPLGSSSFTYYIALIVNEQKFVHIFSINVRIMGRIRVVMSRFYSSRFQLWSDKNKIFNAKAQSGIF